MRPDYVKWFTVCLLARWQTNTTISVSTAVSDVSTAVSTAVSDVNTAVSVTPSADSVYCAVSKATCLYQLSCDCLYQLSCGCLYQLSCDCLYQLSCDCASTLGCLTLPRTVDKLYQLSCNCTSMLGCLTPPRTVDKLDWVIQHVTLGQQLVTNTFWSTVRHCVQETLHAVKE